jgi:Ethanolamine utilization protein
MTETSSNCDGQRKPLMLIGPVGAGKSTLLRALELCDGVVKKTEAMVYMDQAIDTPGEMITIPHFYNALILNSVRARLVLFLMDASRPTQLPSRLALTLRAPVLGLISKIDLATEDNLRKARAALTGAGVKNIVEISSVTGQGLDELNKWITGSPDPAPAG